MMVMNSWVRLQGRMVEETLVSSLLYKFNIKWQALQIRLCFVHHSSFFCCISDLQELLVSTWYNLGISFTLHCATVYVPSCCSNTTAHFFGSSNFFGSIFSLHNLATHPLSCSNV